MINWTIGEKIIKSLFRKIGRKKEIHITSELIIATAPLTKQQIP